MIIEEFKWILWWGTQKFIKDDHIEIFANLIQIFDIFLQFHHVTSKKRHLMIQKS